VVSLRIAPTSFILASTETRPKVASIAPHITSIVQSKICVNRSTTRTHTSTVERRTPGNARSSVNMEVNIRRAEGQRFHFHAEVNVPHTASLTNNVHSSTRMEAQCNIVWLCHCV